eukprot:COSAG06_NODE_968_length_11280_cov_125.578302_2_plen_99_part_00
MLVVLWRHLEWARYSVRVTWPEVWADYQVVVESHMYLGMIFYEANDTVVLGHPAVINACPALLPRATAPRYCPPHFGRCDLMYWIQLWHALKARATRR